MYESIILAAAKAVGVSGVLLLAICGHESLLNPNAINKYDNGSPSYGLCQIKHETAEMLGHNGTTKDLMDPKINAKWAAEYLKFQSDRYKGDWLKATSAYNAGSYRESTKTKNCPKNLKYVKYIKNRLPQKYKHRLECGKIK